MLIYYLQMLDTPEEKVRFEQIYLKYRGLIYRVADSILHNRQDAEDAVHNAFLKIIRRFFRFQNTPARDLAPQVAVIARKPHVNPYGTPGMGLNDGEDISKVIRDCTMSLEPE